LNKLPISNVNIDLDVVMEDFDSVVNKLTDLEIKFINL